MDFQRRDRARSVALAFKALNIVQPLPLAEQRFGMVAYLFMLVLQILVALRRDAAHAVDILVGDGEHAAAVTAAVIFDLPEQIFAQYNHVLCRTYAALGLQ